MPYRYQVIGELCNRCRDSAVGRCRRCGAPLCPSHAPVRGRRCESCEEVFRDGKDRAVMVLALVELLWVVGVVAGVSLGFSGLERLPALLTFGAMVLLLGLPPLLLSPARRSLFLLQRRRWRAVDD